MKDEIIIDGTIYVKKDKESIKYDIGVLDCASISMLFSIHQDFYDKDDESIITLPRPNLCFKLNGKLDDFTMKYNGKTLKSKNGTLISKDMIKNSSVMINSLHWKSSKKELDFNVYESLDKEQNNFKKGFPILLINGNYGVVIVPRVDTDEM